MVIPVKFGMICEDLNAIPDQQDHAKEVDEVRRPKPKWKAKAINNTVLTLKAAQFRPPQAMKIVQSTDQAQATPIVQNRPLPTVAHVRNIVALFIPNGLEDIIVHHLSNL